MEVKRKHVVSGLLLLVIAASFLGVFRTCGSKPHDIRIDLIKALRLIAAEKTAAFLEYEGSIVLVLPDVPHQIYYDAIDEELVAPCEESGISVIGTEKIALSWGSAPGGSSGGSVGLTGARVFEIAARHPDADAVLSLVGIPEFTDSEFRRAAESLPPLIVSRDARMGPDLEDLIRSGIVAMAIVPKKSLLSTKAEGQDARELFDEYFRIVTRENLDPTP